MYLKNLFIENMGSIEKLQILEKDLFLKNGSPKPIILLGKNGSGKTTLLSCISDSFFELGNKAFNNILPKDGIGYKYYKVSGGGNTKIGARYSFSYLQFRKDSDIYEYIDKNGELTFVDCKRKTNNLLTLQNNWKDAGNTKESSEVKNNKNFESDFGNNSYCIFPANRFEYPYRMIRDSYNKITNIKDSKKYNGDLGKSILVNDSMDEIKSWILDLFLDAKFRLKNNDKGGYDFDDVKNPKDIGILNQGIENIENLLSEILDKKVKLSVNYRGQGSRINVIDGHTNEIVLDGLDKLSAGESILLCMFSTIIRYSDIGDINKSFKLREIEGIVVIDEIDLHLHIRLQKEILPKLIKLLPKVQFIISTHSPFFLYGMSKEYGDNVLMLNMPSGAKITNVDDFEEFNEAYDVFDKLTQDYKIKYNELGQKLLTESKPIVLVEGPTDIQYIKKAYELYSKPINFDIDIIGSFTDTSTKDSDDLHLKYASQVFIHNTSLFNQKILLLHDPENSVTEGEVDKKVYIKRMPEIKNSPITNNKGKAKGIESLFDYPIIKKAYEANKKLFKIIIDGENDKENYLISQNNQGKKKIANWICDNATKKDFKNFEGIFKIIDDMLKD